MLMSEARNSTAFANDEDSRSSTSNMGGLSVKTFGFTGMKISAGAPAAAAAAPQSNGASVPFPSHDVSNDNSNHSVQMPSDSKRKRLMVSDVFNSNEDDEANILNGKKRRPPPNALLEDSNTDSNLSGGSNNKQSSSQLSQEEKRRQIKTLIDKIPTSKNELFNYSIEWDHLDNVKTANLSCFTYWLCHFCFFLDSHGKANQTMDQQENIRLHWRRREDVAWIHLQEAVGKEFGSEFTRWCGHGSGRGGASVCCQVVATSHLRDWSQKAGPQQVKDEAAICTRTHFSMQSRLAPNWYFTLAFLFIDFILKLSLTPSCKITKFRWRPSPGSSYAIG